MSRKQKDFDPKRNQRFAVALNVLRQHSEKQELSQKDSASKMGHTHFAKQSYRQFYQ